MNLPVDNGFGQKAIVVRNVTKDFFDQSSGKSWRALENINLEVGHAPMVLAFVLGPIMETSLRQSLIMSSGDFLIFWASPVAAVLMSVFPPQHFLFGHADPRLWP